MDFWRWPRFTPPRDTASRVATVRGSGAALAKGHTAGYAKGGPQSGGLSDFHASWLFLRASVFPGGLILSLPTMSPRVILTSELRGITEKRSVFGPRLEIDHAGVGTVSPLVLYQGSGSPIGRALRQIAAQAAASHDIRER
jgi:hypothetical protein